MLCEELIDKSRYDDGFFWNSIICKCECDKSCDFREYLDYKNFKYRRKLVDKLALEYEDETIF